VTVHLETTTLTAGIPVMHMVRGDQVRAAYDPDQIDEATALAWLCVCVPRLVSGGFKVRRAVP